jgi:hypothetical protein
MCLQDVWLLALRRVASGQIWYPRENQTDHTDTLWLNEKPILLENGRYYVAGLRSGQPHVMLARKQGALEEVGSSA